MPPARRTPRQQRALATVDRIVDAAELVLAREGYQHASTNRIAAQAGVSPGTLYGYFSSKDEIFARVLERTVTGLTQEIAAGMRGAAGRPLPDATRVALAALLDALEARRDVVAAVIDRVPADWYAAELATLRDQVSGIAYTFAAAERPGADPADLERVTWISVRAIEHLALRWVIERPEVDRGAFIDELTAMALSLLPAA